MGSRLSASRRGRESIEAKPEKETTMLLVGIAMALVFLMLAIFVGGTLGLFIDIPSVIIVLGVSLALLLATHRGSGVGLLFKAPFALDTVDRRRSSAVYQDFKTYAIVSGWLGFIIGCILMGANIDHLESLGPGTAVALITVFYGYTLAYVICHPILRRLEEVSG